MLPQACENSFCANSEMLCDFLCGVHFFIHLSDFDGVHFCLSSALIDGYAMFFENPTDCSAVCP